MKAIQRISCLLKSGSTLLGCLLPAVCLTSGLCAGVFNGGGGDSSGGSYQLSGTIGQPLVGTLENGQYVLRSGFWNVTLQVRINASAESFSNWMNTLAPGDQPPEDERDPLDTPAGDGVPNIFKYAMGLLPMSPSREGYPHFLNYPDPENPGNFLLVIEYIRSTRANVAIWLDGAPNLEDWTEIPYTLEVIEDLGDARERVHLVSAISLGPDEKYFLQLNIELP